MTNYEIPKSNFNGLVEKIEKLNKRAKKIGKTPITLEIVNRFSKKVDVFGKRNLEVDFYEVAVSGEVSVIDGWKLMGVVDFDNGITLVKSVPGFEIPVEYRNADHTNCDHCKKIRSRKMSVIITDGEKVMQVGKTCVKDFLDDSTTLDIMTHASWLKNLLVSLEDAGNVEDSGYGVVSSKESVREYLAHSIAVIDAVGYKPSWEDCPTKYRVWTNIYPKNKYDYEGRIEVQEKDKIKAAKVIEWLVGLSDGDLSSDYLYNLNQIVSQETFNQKNAGLLASAYVAYMKAQDAYLAKEKEVKVPSNYLGTVGEKIEAKVTVMKVFIFTGKYGTGCVINMLTEDGNCLKWFTKPNKTWMESGTVLTISGTVKGFEVDEYNKNSKTTILKGVKRVDLQLAGA